MKLVLIELFLNKVIIMGFYENCQRFRPYETNWVHIYGQRYSDESVDKILDLLDMYCDIQEILISEGYKQLIN